MLLAKMDTSQGVINLNDSISRCTQNTDTEETGSRLGLAMWGTWTEKWVCLSEKSREGEPRRTARWGKNPENIPLKRHSS